MSNLITLSIDVTLIEKTRLVPGKKKNKKDKIPQYLDLVLIPTRPTQYGDSRDENTHMVCHSLSKEERDAGVQGPILGNAKELQPRGQQTPAPRPAQNATPEVGQQPPEEQDVPF
jgi:hypothetical protein